MASPTTNEDCSFTFHVSRSRSRFTFYVSRSRERFTFHWRPVKLRRPALRGPSHQIPLGRDGSAFAAEGLQTFASRKVSPSPRDRGRHPPAMRSRRYTGLA